MLNDLVKVLTTERIGTHTQQEDVAFQHLLHGYDLKSAQIWVSVEMISISHLQLICVKDDAFKSKHMQVATVNMTFPNLCVLSARQDNIIEIDECVATRHSVSQLLVYLNVAPLIQALAVLVYH
jgi:hypothetical protein